MNNLIGQHLGPYRVLEQIGTGGMATVYKAYQPAMDRYVAVKVIASHFAQDETFLKRFRREARAVAKLEHAHILPVYDSGEAEGRPYLVMRFLEAGTLKDRMTEEPLPLDEVNRTIGQVGSALDYAHRMGVIHRDVKPANVLLDAEGDAFLTDFGLAKMVESSAQLTGTGVGIGTPAYMSPEQGKGAKVDSRADVYSLGVMLYEMVTGHAPYEAETPLAVVLKHITEPLPLPRSVRPDLPEEVERVILRALAKEPDDRFQTAGEMVRALDAAVRAAEAALRTEPVVAEMAAEPVVAEAAAPPLERVAPRVERVLPAGWGRVVAWAAVGVVALVAFFLLLSRVPLRVQISGGQLEVVRVVEEMPAATPTPIPTEQEETAPVAATPIPGSPADQARAFAEPILSAIADRAPDYEDDFSDPGGGWDIGSSDAGDEWGYEDGAYFILIGQGEHGAGVPQPDRAPHLSDFVLEVDAQFISGESGLWGVIFRDLGGTAEPGDHYAVGFWPDGHFRVWKNIGGNHIELLATDASPVPFEDGFETNHLAIIAQGPQITFYVNGEPLWFIHDESVSRGRIQLLAENAEADSSLRVRFDNFKVWDITGLPLPSAEATPVPVGECRITYEQGGDIYVRNCDGSDERKLTDDPAGDWLPTWSPNGTRIVFGSNRDAGGEDRNQIYVMDADGSNQTRLTHTEHNEEHPSWSPDGSRIAFHSGCGLVVVNADGSNWATLIGGGGEDLCVQQPTWSPDSHRIAFISEMPPADPGLYKDIYVVNDDGSGLLKLTAFTSEGGGYAVWSPDSSRVAFDAVLDGQQKYYTVNSDGSGEPVEVESIPDSWYPWYWPQWGGEQDITAAPTPAPGSAADQARAFAEPILAAIADRPPDFEDDFSDPASGWPIWPIGLTAAGDAWGYEDGAYFVSLTPSYRDPDGDCSTSLRSDRAPWSSDFVLEVDAQFVSGGWGRWHVGFRQSESGTSSYLMDIFPNGDFQLHKSVNDDATTLVQGQDVSVSSFEEGLGTTNRLAIIAQGPWIAVYVNGELLCFAYDESLSRGVIALGISNFADAPLRVHFDNFKVWDITDLPLPSAEAMATPQPATIPTPSDPVVSAQEHADRAAEYVARAHWDEAIAEITRAIELDPTNPQYYITRAFFYDAGKGMMEEAVADATKAIELAPALYDAWNGRGAVYAHMEECTLAVADHNEAIKLDPDRFDGYTYRADALCCQGKLDAAIADYDHAITIDPTSAWTFWNRGKIYEEKGDLDAAIADYGQAITLKPDDPWASVDYYYSRAGAYRALGQHEQALADCDAALALAPDDPQGFYCQGLSEVALGQMDEARADFEQAVSLIPISAWSAWVTDAAQAELDKMGP